MEKTNSKNTPVAQPTEDETGKAIRISSEHHELLKKGRNKINEDTTFTKKISFTRYVEKLIEDYWEKPIEELQKEREGSKDWLEVEHKRTAPDIPFFDWLRSRVEENAKKGAKKNKSIGATI